MQADTTGLAAVAPRLQRAWDWRAAMNFILGGAGGGLFAVSLLAGLGGGAVSWAGMFLALALVAAGLAHVWAEIGRPGRFLNVFRHPSRSWMSREALIAAGLFALGGPAWLLGAGGREGPALLIGLAALPLALGFVHAQGRILRAAKAIPAWRQPPIVALILATGLAEGVGLLAMLAGVGLVAGGAAPDWLAGLLIFCIALRLVLHARYRLALGRAGAPVASLAALDAYPGLRPALQFTLAGLALYGGPGPDLPLRELALALAGLGVLASGWGFKFVLITRAGFDQGYAINRFPARGAGRARPGLQPGWMRA